MREILQWVHYILFGVVIFGIIETKITVKRRTNKIRKILKKGKVFSDAEIIEAAQKA